MAMICNYCEKCTMAEQEMFRGIEIEEKELINSMCTMAEYKKNDIIFLEGESVPFVYLVKQGQVRLFKINEDGKEINLDIRFVEDLVSGHNLFSDDLTAYCAMALSDTLICQCKRDDFVKLLEHSNTSHLLMKKLIKNIESNYENMSVTSAEDKILAQFRSLVSDGMTSKGQKLSCLLTHEEIAQLCNISRVTATNVIHDLKNRGIIYAEGQQYFLSL